MNSNPWSSRLGVERGANHPASQGRISYRKSLITETIDEERNSVNGSDSATTHLNIEGVPENFIIREDADMTSAGESLTEAYTLRRYLSHPKTKLRFGCWNVKTLYQLGKTAQLCKEMDNYGISALGVSECRWTGIGKVTTQTGHVIIYSGREERHEHGVAIVMNKETAKCLISWRPVGERIITARFNSNHVKTTIIQAYAPTNVDSDANKDEFYEQLQSAYDEIPKHDTVISMGDWNAKLGQQMPGEEGIVGKEVLPGERSDNGERLASSCAANNMAVVTTQFKQKNIHKYTWTSPDGRTRNQIDHIAVNGRFRSSIINARAYRGADIASDHNLVICDMKLKLNKVKKTANKTKKFDTMKLQRQEVRNSFALTLKNRFSCLQQDEETAEPTTEAMEKQWTQVKEAYNKAAESVLGQQRSKSKPWISEDSWGKIDKRKATKRKIEDAKSERLKDQKREEYKSQDREVKHAVKRDKKMWTEGLAKEAEDSMQKGNLKAVYSTTKKICNQHTRKMDSVKDKNGRLLTTEKEVQQRWQEHFSEVLNRPEPEIPAVIPEEDFMEEIIISEEPLSKEEIIDTVRELKNGKAAGFDEVSPDVLKADPATTADVLQSLLKRIWELENMPEDWRKGLIIKLPKKGDLTRCGNWRGITLLSVVGKVMARSIIKRMRDAVDRRLRKEQGGFRPNRGTGMQIFILRNIIEQSLEWNASLYLVFVDYEKAFDSIHRETLWKIMRHYGIPEKYIRLVKMFYNSSKCSVITEEGAGPWFDIMSGVKQGCVMSGFLFILVIDWIMRQTVKQQNTGIQWTLAEKLEDLDYADDIVTTSSSWNHAQQKVTRLSENGLKTGLKINKEKTKTIRINSRNANPIVLDGDDVEDVETFKYLGAYVDKTGGANYDIRCRIGQASSAFKRFTKVWNSSSYWRRTKIRLFNSNVVSVLLYGCETWKMNKGDAQRLDVFYHRCLRRILKIRWPMRMSNQEVRRRANIASTISQQIRRRRWRMIGHVLRSKDEHTKIALSWTPQGKRSRGRPRKTWQRTAERERKEYGFTSWEGAGAAARSKAEWRSFINGPIVHWDRRS